MNDERRTVSVRPVAQFGATHGAVMVFDLSGRTPIELTGADRAKFLQGFCTNAIKRLKPDQGCEVFLPNIKGKVVGHVFVFATESSMWLDTVSGQAVTIISHLDRYLICEDTCRSSITPPTVCHRLSRDTVVDAR